MSSVDTHSTNAPLSSYARDVTSQNGEDGLIEALLADLGIDSGWCVEFGAWDGKHLSNTWNLWHERKFASVLIEGDARRAKALEQSVEHRSDVHVVEAYVGISGPNSLDAILGRTEIPTDFAVLSIDIDSDDYAIWDSLRNYTPKIVLIEYNQSFDANTEFVQEPGQSIGSSGKSLSMLGERKDYDLVAVTDTNLIFVRSDIRSSSKFPRVDFATELKPTLQPLVYSDFLGRHYVLRSGPWGYQGMKPPQSRFKIAYQLVGKKVYRRAGRFPFVQELARRINPRGSYHTIDLRDGKD